MYLFYLLIVGVALAFGVVELLIGVVILAAVNIFILLTLYNTSVPFLYGVKPNVNVALTFFLNKIEF